MGRSRMPCYLRCMKAKHIGLTGSIGAGKSTAAAYFKQLDVPVYHADDAAKRLMVEDQALMDAIERAFGPGIYVDGVLQKGALADKAFADKSSTETINALVHPAVHQDFVQWHEAQDHPYVLREAAILFEAGSYNTCDAIVLVEAPQVIRLQRVMERSGLTPKQVEQRMARQWSDAKKRSMLTDKDLILDNSGDAKALKQMVATANAYLLKL